MFNVAQDTRWSYSSPSPPSSPTAYNDSSPAPSPDPDSAAFSNDYPDGEPSRASPPMDPFAASANRAWIPPEYEKGAKKYRQVSPSSPPRSRSKKPRLLGPESSLETVVSLPPRVFAPQTEEEKEAAIWDAAITKLFDAGNGTVLLEQSNLTRFPAKFIDDLSNFYVAPETVESLNSTRHSPVVAPREFSRSITAPAILSRMPDRIVGSARQEIRLYLAGNQISRLPVQLLGLKKMTILSLRNNQLTSLPPEIQQLQNLHTLNIAGNRLEYLPAEILGMTLKILTVFPNRFKEQPMGRSTSSRRPFHREKSQGRVAVSPTSRPSQRIPSLVELSLRSLFSTGSANPTNHAERRIEKYYELPLCEADVDLGSSGSGKKEFRQVIPPHLRRILDAIHPGSVDTDASWEPVDEPPSLGLCPSPRHLHRASVFVTPAEERYTWETVVAGVDVGGSVPLKWRGCLCGCLDFLDAEVELETPSKVVEAPTEMDVDGEQQVVTRMQFGPLGTDDFEDDG
ncbi:hypothetical protein B0H14DRAFT_2689949 [Mycena olivaceomarginata]|nr:hypothetical protein B0H14DRAFT_2689949 [Mycena olivaceomarginata]